MTHKQRHDTIDVKEAGIMPIESKKQSQAKNDWMKENSKIYSVRVMKKTETELFNFIEQQKAKGIDAAAVFKTALREYMANHAND